MDNMITKASAGPRYAVPSKEQLAVAMRAYVQEEKSYASPVYVTVEDRSAYSASLRGHIVKGHLKPRALSWFGVPRYDIELAAFGGVRLDWVVDKTYEIIESSTKSLEEAIRRESGVMTENLNAYRYREMAVRTLVLIEKHNLADVDWERVSRSFDRVQEIMNEPHKEVRFDRSFFESGELFFALAWSSPNWLMEQMKGVESFWGLNMDFYKPLRKGREQSMPLTILLAESFS